MHPRRPRSAMVRSPNVEGRTSPTIRCHCDTVHMGLIAFSERILGRAPRMPNMQRHIHRRSVARQDSIAAMSIGFRELMLDETLRATGMKSLLPPLILSDPAIVSARRLRRPTSAPLNTVKLPPYSLPLSTSYFSSPRIKSAHTYQRDISPETERGCFPTCCITSSTDLCCSKAIDLDLPRTPLSSMSGLTAERNRQAEWVQHD